jgi:hypothetical protein
MATMYPYHNRRPRHFHPQHDMNSRTEILLLVGGLLICGAIALISYFIMRA